MSDFLLFQAMRRGLFSDSGDGSMKDHFDKLFDESANLNSQMIDFLEPLVGTMIKMHLPEGPTKTEKTDIESTGLKEIKMPFFIELLSPDSSQED